jgi:aryl-alcohol dehydrogenase-like predicted oxidoreductase
MAASRWWSLRPKHDGVARKVGSNMGDGPNMHGGSRKHILEHIDRSLRKLQTEYLDLYQIHYVRHEALI